MKSILSVILILSTLNVYADAIFPAGCQPVVVSEETVMLKSPKPAVVLIHNLSQSELWITHPIAEPSASAGWTSRIQGGNWSALALQDKSFEISCIESKPGHEQQVPCAGVLAVCQWEIKSTPANETGTYWAGEDMALPALTAQIGQRGLVLTAPAQ